MRNLSTYAHLGRTYSREDSANVVRMLMGVAISVIRVGLISAIYAVAYKKVRPGSTLSYANAMWSIGIYYAFIINLGIRNVFKIVNREVNTGVVEVGLLKPIDWRLSKICELLGKNTLEFSLQLVVLPLALLLFVGAPDVSHLTPMIILEFVLLTALAMVTASAMFLTAGLLAFWLNDAMPAYRILDKITLVFGGAFVPIALLPHAAQLFVRYSPFGVYAAPTQLFNPGIVPHLSVVMAAAVFWSIVLIGLCEVVWRRALIKVEVNGG